MQESADEIARQVCASKGVDVQRARAILAAMRDHWVKTVDDLLGLSDAQIKDMGIPVAIGNDLRIAAGLVAESEDALADEEDVDDVGRGDSSPGGGAASRDRKKKKHGGGSSKKKKSSSSGSSKKARNKGSSSRSKNKGADDKKKPAEAKKSGKKKAVITLKSLSARQRKLWVWRGKTRITRGGLQQADFIKVQFIESFSEFVVLQFQLRGKWGFVIEVAAEAQSLGRLRRR